MRKAIDRCFVVLIMLVLLPMDILPQREASIPIKKQEAFVLEYKAPYDRILIDVGTNNFTEAETVTLDTPATLPFTNKKNKPIDRALLRPGTRIEINGERSATRIVASSIKVLTDLEKWEVELKGYFESLDGDKAWVDGQPVKLAPGIRIRGDDKWTGQTYATFNDVPAGAELKVQGIRRADGIVYANSAAVEPNEFTKPDRDVKLLAQRSMILPANLTGGKGMVAGREVKFANDLELQTYVTKVGNRLVPRYQKDLPADFPSKLVYRFAVIEDESFNAFALPDGSIFVHTGLLKQIKNEAQLATILGHEIAHVTHEHSRKRMYDQKGPLASLGLTIAGAIAGGQTGAQLGAMAGQAFINDFGRDAEDQADRVGLYYMTQVGYDPREGPKVWREVAKNSPQDKLSNILYSNHSLASARLKNMNREIAYNYHDTNFATTKVGADEYMDVVGVYFGWKPRPAPPVVSLPANAQGSSGGGKGALSRGTRKGTSVAPKLATFSAPHIKLAHRKVLQYWLAPRKGWRPVPLADVYVGLDADSRRFTASEVKALKHHPFYIAGDFNGDKKEDFAVILKSGTGKTERYAAVIFNGPLVASASFLPAFYTEQLGRGDWLFWMTDQDFGKRFIIGPPSSDAGFIVRSSGSGYVIE